MAFKDLISRSRADGYDRARVEKLIAEYLQAAKLWGPRMELRALVDVGLSLSKQEYLPDIALDYLNSAEQKFDDQSPQPWKQLVGIERGKRLIESGQGEQGAAILKEMRDHFPFDPDVTYALARHAEKSNRTDEALALYAELHILPQLEQDLAESLKKAGQKLPPERTVRRIVARLWQEQHGDLKGLAAYLDEIYEARIRSIADERRPPRSENEGTRVVLCELFTGGRCNPCVASDVATAALEAAYAPSEVIVLRFHEHVPGPDPLANEDTQERFKLYGGENTPSLVLNGRRFPVNGGGMPQAIELYRALHAVIEPILEEKTELRLDLSAHEKNGRIAISAKALGLEFYPNTARLQLMIAESRIECLLQNGIRFHDMVVRAMPLGAEGLAPVQGALAYSGEVDLAGLRRRIIKHLASIEREKGALEVEVPLALKKLHLVGVLQSRETGEVLQAAAVPIDEETPSGEAAAAPLEKKSLPKKPDSGKN